MSKRESNSKGSLFKETISFCGLLWERKKKRKVIIQVYVLVKTLMLLHQKLGSHPQLQRLELLQRKTQKILPLIPILNIH